MGRVVLAAAMAALLGAGCGERAEPVDRAEVVYPVTIGDKTFPARPNGVATPDESSMPVLLSALGYRGRGDPDVLLAWATEAGAASAEEAERGYVAAASSIDEVVRSIAEIGVILGEPAGAREVVDRIAEQRAQVREAVAGRPPVRVFIDLGFFATAGDRTLVGDMIREAGGENVAGATPEPGPFPLLQLAQLAPEVYILASGSRSSADSLRKNPRTRRISAIRENRIVVVDAERLRPGPSVGEGLLALAEALHPGST